MGRRDLPVEAWLEGLVLAKVAHDFEEERVARAQGTCHQKVEAVVVTHHLGGEDAEELVSIV